MRCPSCGREAPDALFCEWCGHSLKPRTSPLSELKPGSLAASSSSTTRADSHSIAATNGKTDSSNLRPSDFTRAALAILLYLVIADAAVETFLRESPLRWWIAGASAIYFVLCVVVWRFMPKLWRHLNWTSQAGLSLIVLLGLLSGSAWMPGGLDQGIGLLGQPTSGVLAGLSALGVALSGIFLVRLQFIPRAGKIIAGLLASYGVLSFIFAIGATTPYVSLFHGQSQWTRLPFWLQGATIGGLFLVPVALLLEIITGFSRVTRAKISEFSFRVLALGMCLVITVAAIRTPEEYAADGAIEPPPWLSKGNDKKLPQGEAGYKVVSERLNRMYAALDVINSKVDRSLFEIDALADRLGSDPTAIFHFVRDEIRYEPYVGVLRGPLGTLLCRAGNSLDRSMLLAALLQKAGLTTQIVSGSLNSQQAQTLVNRLFEPVKPVPQAVPSIAELAPEIGKAMGVDPAKLLQVADEMQKYGQQQNKQLMDYVDSESAYLSGLLSKAGVDAGVVTPDDQLVAEASQHYWVQYQNASGQWVDLDSSFTDAEPGKANTQVTNTFAHDAVPEDLYYHLRVTLTLRVTQVNDGKDGDTSDTVLLDQELRVAEQQGKNIVVANIPDPMPDFMQATGTLGDALASTKGFQTVLQVGDKATTGKSFDLNGKVTQRLTGAPEAEVANNAGGIGGGFGALGGGANDALGGAKQMSTRRIVGEWVEYKLNSPGPAGAAPVTHDYRRDILSNESPESGSAISLGRQLIWCSELYPIVGSIIPGYAGYLDLESVRDGSTKLDLALQKAYGLLPNQPANLPLSQPIANIVLASQVSYLARSFSNQQFAHVASYLGTPGLIAYEATSSHSSEGEMSGEGYDIVTFPPRIVGTPDADPKIVHQEAALLHVKFGTLATRDEFKLALGSATQRGHNVRIFNATKIFTAAQQMGLPISVLRSDLGGVDLSKVAVSSQVKSELTQELQAKNIILIPARPVAVDGEPRTAWWRLNESSGEFVGMGPSGRGQELTEYIEAAENVNFAICMVGAFKQSSNNLASGAMCVLSYVVGANGAEEDRFMTYMGMLIDVIHVTVDAVADEDE